MGSKSTHLFQDELKQLAQVKRICGDKQYKNNEMITHYTSMAQVFEKNLRFMMKMIRISDSQQVYLQGIQEELQRESEERRKVEKNLRDSYDRCRRNQFLTDLAEGKRFFDEVTWENARQLHLYLPNTFHVYYLYLKSWQGTPIYQLTNRAVQMDMNMDCIVDKLNTLSEVVAWEWGNGFGIIYSSSVGEGQEQQIHIATMLKDKLEAEFSQVKFAVGIAWKQGEISRFAHQCNQARVTVHIGCRLWPERDIYHYHDSGAYELLDSLVAGQDANDFIEKTIGNLLNFEQENNSELLITLEKIITASNLKVAAQEMFLHHKTIVGRKQRIEAVLNTSLDTFDSRFNIMIALYLLKLRG